MADNSWFYAALGCSILWGLSYSLTEKIMENDVPVTVVMAFTGFFYFIFSLFICFSMGEIKPGLISLGNNKSNLILLIATSGMYVLGAYLIYFAINEKNATLASMVEITYPLFVFLFSMIIYRDVQLNWWAALGGIFIFVGVCIIYYKNGY